MNLPLPKKKKYSAKNVYGKDRNIMILLVISAIFSTILFLLAFLFFLGIIAFKGDALNGFDFIVFGILSTVGPIGFYNYLKAKRKREIEEQLPDFLREISSSTSSGMTVFDAIKSASTGDYGRLTPELKDMAAQLSWGISVDQALNNFAEKINTPRVKRIAVTINKALEIGGNTSAVFDAAAKEIDQTKLVEQQRKTEMSMYSIVIFISFFVFLAVLLIVNSTIFSAIYDLQTKMADAGTAAGALGNSNVAISTNIDPFMVKNTFFLFVLVQSVGGGLLGGFMMDGKLSSGVRFCFVLVLVSFFIFKLLL